MWPEPDQEQEQRIIRTIGGNAAFHNFHNDYGHIQDPNKRRRLALSEIDKVPFGWYHVRAVTVAGIGFFTDSYDIFAINLAVQMLGITFWQGDGGNIPSNVQTAIKAATSGGAVIGQIGFGWLADLLGRRRMYGIELVTIISATLAQSLSSPSPAMSMTGLLIFWRVVMGIGIGGDYPMSSVITSEFAPTRWRGAMMAAVFSMQGAGQFAAALVALIVTAGFKKSFSDTSLDTCGDACQLAADRCWRIIIGAGALPALFALYYRITIPETPRYTFDVAQDIEQADADIQAFKEGKPDGHPDPLLRERTKIVASPALVQPRASWADFFSYFGNWKNGSLLFATMSSWFFLDLAFYGLGLNNTLVLQAIGYGSSSTTVYQTLFNAAVGNLIIVCAGSLPGYWLSVAFIDTLGRRPIQICGFAILTLLFCVIGFAYNSLSEGTLLALYILAQLFFNFGPNTTTFIVPGECFATRYRSTAHGLSAASGKVGAIVAQVIAQYLLTKDEPPHCSGNDCSPWLPHLMEIFACFMFCGTVVSLLIPETKRLTLEELAGEKPLHNRSSGTASPGSKKGFLSPVLGPMRSPRIPALSNNGGHNGKSKNLTAITTTATKPKRSHGSTHTSSRDFKRESGERSSQGPDSVSSEAAILQYPPQNHSVAYAKAYPPQQQEHTPQSPTTPKTRGHARTDSVGSSRYWTESIPLQDVGGLVQK